MIAFTPDGQALHSWGLDRTMRRWDLRTGRELARSNREGKPAPVAFTPDGKAMLVLDFQKKAVVLEDAATGKEQGRIAMPKGMPNPPRLALSADRRTICILDSRVREVPIQMPKILDMARYEVRRSHSYTLLVWDLVANRELSHPSGKGILSSLFLSPDGKTLGAIKSSTEDVVTINTGKEVAPATRPGFEKLFELGKTFSNLVAFDPEAKLVARSTGQGCISVIEVKTGKEKFYFRGHQGDVTTLAFSSDGRRLASGSLDQTILIWDLTTP
jgi:WD40 repeat protein